MTPTPRTMPSRLVVPSLMLSMLVGCSSFGDGSRSDERRSAASALESRSSEALLALYTFDEGSGSSVMDVSGSASAPDLQIEGDAVTWLPGALRLDGPTRVSSVEPAAALVESVVASGELTVEAWVTTASTSQNGPARIVSISASPYARNFTLGQGVWGSTGDRLEARMRSTSMSDNGTPSTRSVPGSFDVGLHQLVFTRDAGGNAHLYVDGTLVASRGVPGSLDNWSNTMPLLLGGEADDSRHWLGSYHLLAIYGRALSQAEIDEHLALGPEGGVPEGGMPDGSMDAGGEAGSSEAGADADADAAPDADAASDAAPDATADADADGSADAAPDAADEAGMDAAADGAMDAASDATMDAASDAASEAGAGERVPFAPVALWTFDEGAGDTVYDVSDNGSPLDLMVGEPAAARWFGGGLELTEASVLSSSAPASKIRDAVQASQALTVEAWVSVDDLDQNGPARIVSISTSPFSRNLTLGQGVYGSTGDRLEVRLRTTTTSDNGRPSTRTPGGSLSAGTHHLVFTREVSGDTTVYVDSVAVASGSATGELSNWDPNMGMLLGNEADGSRPWLGSYHLVAIYDLALTPAEVEQNYAAGADPDMPPADGGVDGGPEAGADGSLEAGTDAGTDAGPEAGLDAGTDASPEAGPEAGADADTDAGGGGGDAMADAASDGSTEGGSGADAGADAGSDAGGRVGDDLVALYTFDEGQGSVIGDSSGSGTPLDLSVGGYGDVSWVPGGLSVSGAVIESEGPASKIADAVTQSGELSVEAWVDVNDLQQGGPARVVSMSGDSLNRNFTLGQGLYNGSYDLYSMRLRTTSTGGNGTPELTTAAGAVSAGLHHLLFTRDASGAWSFYVDGAQTGSGSRGGELSNWDPSYPLLLGDEATGGRTWDGEYQLVAIYARALGSDEVLGNFAAGPDGDGTTPNSRPVADFEVSVASDDPLTFTFDASGSYDNDGSIVSFDWDFGDGTNGGGAVVTHTYADDSPRDVTLVVTDSGGKTASATTRLTPGGTSGGGGNAAGGVRWTTLTSADGDLPMPLNHSQQPATIVLDADNDGADEFVIVARQGSSTPTIVWYDWTDSGWVTHVIETDIQGYEAGGAAHDIDGDGDQDFVLGEGYWGPRIWWWENPYPELDPVDGWERHVIKNSGDDQAHDQAFGDIDGDGDVELAYWNNLGDENLFVADIPADPTIEPWPAVSIFQGIGGWPPSEGLDVGDVNLDGVDDLVGAGHWFEHTGGGSYTAHPIDTSQGYTRSAVGQLIEGGRPEIVIDSGDAIGRLYMYAWDGTSWVRTDLLGEPSEYGHSLNLGDVNQDGHLDIMSAEMALNENTSPDMRLLFGDGAGNFEQVVLSTEVGNHESKFADLDGDGDIDIVGKPFQSGAPGVNLWINEGPDVSSSWTRHVVDESMPSRTIFVEAADIDLDGYDDIITGGHWWKNPGSIDGNWVRSSFGAPVSQLVTVHDFDADGDPDVLATWATGSEPEDRLAWAENQGDGSFVVHENVETADGTFLQGRTVGNYHGTLQVALSWQNGNGGLQFIDVPSPANTVSQPWTWSAPGLATPGEGLDTGDIDGDGLDDILAGEVWFQNDGAGGFVSHELMNVGGDSDRNILVDMDADGDLDAVIGFGHDPQGKLSWFEQPDDPTAPWIEHSIAFLAPGQAQSVDVADMDGDGDYDIVAGEHTNPESPDLGLWAFENTASGWVQHEVYIGDEHHDGALLHDLDKDGDLDIISMGWLHRRLMVYENDAKSAGGGTPPASWNCDLAAYGTGNGCDCGCGATDPDCADTSLASCDQCDDAGSCSLLGCSDVDPVDNAYCAVPSDVQVFDGYDEGQDAFIVRTPAASYAFHKTGAGISSLVDNDGRDWVDYHVGGQFAGEYRGIPNMGDCCHPGYPGGISGKVAMTTTVEIDAPQHVQLRSVSAGGEWEVVWNFYPSHLTATVVAAGANYYFGYEGPPGGTLDSSGPMADYLVLPDGSQSSINTEIDFDFEADAGSPEWAGIVDPALGRSLVVVQHQGDDVPDRVWNGDDEMLVFHLGRTDHGDVRGLSATPLTFSYALIDAVDHATMQSTVDTVVAY